MYEIVKLALVRSFLKTLKITQISLLKLRKLLKKEKNFIKNSGPSFGQKENKVF